MKTKLIFLIVFVLTISACSKNDEQKKIASKTNKVLFLKVDHNLNKFEGGTELNFADTSTTMTISKIYVSPGDFGSIKLNFQEVNKPLFDGTIVWMGLGKMNFPDNLLDESQFERVLTNDYVIPNAGFENVFNPTNQTYDYNSIWSSVQSLVKVREFLKSNPNATVKLFLYTPSQGVGNPADWDWIIMMKN